RWRGRRRRLQLPCDRRPRRRRLVAGNAARPIPGPRTASRRAVPGDLLRRDLSRRRPAGLRVQLLPAVQGRREAHLRDPRQPRLVQRARRVRGESHGAGGGPGGYDAREALTALVTPPDRKGVESAVAEAARLRAEYGVHTAEQRAPFFEIHGRGFSLIAADTG